jgi:hypothetical protein
MSDPYDFEDVRMDVSADVTGSSPPARLSVAIGPPLGTLFESSPASVASEVTRGKGEMKEFVCCWFVMSVMFVVVR